jgi:ribosomal protein L37AE/L43A
MPTQGKCPTPDCQWSYDVHKELGRNIAHHENKLESQRLQCPFCRNEISSKFTVCSKCGHVVLGNKAFRKSYVFLAICLLLVLMSYILNDGMK